MRTTVTLDPDAEQLIRRRMKERKVSFKRALNDLVREGDHAIGERTEFRTATWEMGLPTVDLDKAMLLAAELEDEEIARRMQTGS